MLDGILVRRTEDPQVATRDVGVPSFSTPKTQPQLRDWKHHAVRTILTISLSHPRKNVTISAYLATGCRTTRPMYRSRSPRLASTNSLLNLPAYCFSGSGGSAIPGRRRVSAVCKITKWENRRWTVTRVGDRGKSELCSPSKASDGSVWNRDVTLYVVNDPESVELHFVGECTRTRNGGNFVFQAGPASTKCLSASPIPSLLNWI